MTEEKMRFEAEVSRLLDIVVHSLYSNKDIFLRELISNASDACDKLRYEAIAKPELLAGDSEFKVRLLTDNVRNVLTIADNGIGMNKTDLIENLGTIANSGTAKFVEALSKSDKAKDVDLIGQFGVGFYSAFMVAGQVDVVTKKAGEDQAWKWSSDGKGEYTIAEAEMEGHGTQITLHLTDDFKEFTEEYRLRHIVKTYSDHIGIPVVLMKADGNDETLNEASALWTRPKSDITDEQYKEFYKHNSHAFDDPWKTIHYQAEGAIEYTGLLFLPTMRPFDLYDPARKGHLKLYVRKVFITEGADDLLPPWLRFVSGVVDSQDLPLNISREMLQHNPVLTKIKNGLTKKLLSELETASNKDSKGFETFWENFGSVVKEGLYEDYTNRDRILKLARFRSTHSDGWTTLADYVTRMKDGQKAIYYISGEDVDALKRSPQLEGFAAKGIEVLLLTDPVDEFWLPSVGQFEEKDFKSVTRGGADLADVKSDDKDDAKDDKKDDAASDASLDALIASIKIALGTSIKDVRESDRLTSSACCLIADETGMDLRMERLMKQHNRVDEISPRILEINPKHSLIKKLSDIAIKDAKTPILHDAALLLLDQARILEGEALPDPVSFARRLDLVMEKGLGS
ncbi:MULTISPECIES: molecular chaperone HtpG [Thalassospira]|uniref:Chaperone protein HtpG n=1 Tax=Thalassospira xiamenensis M-5 = DSM 17429 TaxID=1123366 RepID=A0AB72U945_9PROT|nr:molecular chaperone HtpG [Thalassospira xiamenensis]AJD50689.1 heat shock protein 90 [Thalassospira xiamenensis M-5 = DSM 17429]RCK41570.1 heat shock protein 90 [Thalassospira xiamenensis]SIS74074.1 molecular chaperone HtpG [Thalassospira xiamenensis M-5 = DSM 17429]